MKKIFSIILLVGFFAIVLSPDLLAQNRLLLPFEKRVNIENDTLRFYWRKPPLETIERAGYGCLLPAGAIIEVVDSLSPALFLCYVENGSNGVGGKCPNGTYFLQSKDELTIYLLPDGKQQERSNTINNAVKNSIKKHKEEKEKDKGKSKKSVRKRRN
jgi:hypothetical protein